MALAPITRSVTFASSKIAEHGPFNGFPHLKFKAYLSAKSQNEVSSSSDKLYAPFYWWEEAEDALQFLSHQGFKALTENLGKPNFKIGFPLAQRQVSHLSVNHCSRGLELPFAG
nr:DUF4865 family protein [uncultured Cohaesibacter sp.]